MIQPHHFSDQLRYFANGHVCAPAHIYQRGSIDTQQVFKPLGGQIEQENAGIGSIITIEKLPSRSSGAPNYGLLRTAGFGFVHPADEGRNEMGIAGMVIVTRTVE